MVRLFMVAAVPYVPGGSLSSQDCLFFSRKWQAIATYDGRDAYHNDCYSVADEQCETFLLLADTCGCSPVEKREQEEEEGGTE